MKMMNERNCGKRVCCIAGCQQAVYENKLKHCYFHNKVKKGLIGTKKSYLYTNNNMWSVGEWEMEEE